jgi:hypothetical protein
MSRVPKACVAGRRASGKARDWKTWSMWTFLITIMLHYFTIRSHSLASCGGVPECTSLKFSKSDRRALLLQAYYKQLSTTHGSLDEQMNVCFQGYSMPTVFKWLVRYLAVAAAYSACRSDHNVGAGKFASGAKDNACCAA